MTTAADTLALRDRALAQAGEVVSALRPEHAQLPTPCSEWDVEAVLAHVIGQDLRNFEAVARGESADWRRPPEPLGADWHAAFDERAARVRTAWEGADLDAVITTPSGMQAPLSVQLNQQIAELALHAWDLTRAADLRMTLDDEVAEAGLAWGRQMLRPEARGAGKPFGEEVTVPDSAPAYARLAGWFGRDPDWRAGRTGV